MEASGHLFERILDDFLGRFLMFFVKRGASSGDAKIIVFYWFLQCLVAIDLLTKSQKIKNMLSKWGVFCRRAVGTTFPSISGRFWLPFWIIFCIDFDIFGNDF